jgi:hypothetical protein
MTASLKGKIHTKAVAQIESVEDDTTFGPHGGFTAVLSSPRRDRDGDIWPMEEWIQPLPDRITVDADHGMSVSTTIGSARPYFDDAGRLMIDASFSSIPRAQEVRTLIREGHVASVSVAALTDNSKKSGEQKRELLNAGVVAIPANPDAVILEAKDAARKALVDDATPGQLLAGIDAVLDEAINLTRDVDRSILPMEVGQALDMLLGVGETIDDLMECMGVFDPDDMLKSLKAIGNGDRALTQAIHDASVHLGASCMTFEESESEAGVTGAAEGANRKSAIDGTMTIIDFKDSTFRTANGESVTFANHDEARAYFTSMLKSIDDADAEGVELVDIEQIKSASPITGMTMEQFKAALSEVLNPTDSPADDTDSPAEAAAATDEVPAPADEAAEKVDEAAEDVDPKRKADHMLMGLYATQFNL